MLEVGIVRWEKGVAHHTKDIVALEEPLEIRVNDESLVVTMRTPGDDFALAAGFLFAEGVIQNAWDIRQMGYSTDLQQPEQRNMLNVALRQGNSPKLLSVRQERSFVSHSSCGVCGKTNLGAVQCFAPPLEEEDLRVSVDIFANLGAKLREQQQVFATTGGLHAAGLFDTSGNLLSLKEDIGRHNAVDKLIGAEVLSGRMPLHQHILMVSGRTSFEIVQKAAMARIPILCAVSAPSSFAVQLAHDLHITLIGFLRGETMNVYTAPYRLLAGEGREG